MSIQLLGTKYSLGGRTFYETALKFRSLAKLAELDQIGGPDNRPTDRTHVRGIRNYLQVEKRPILGSLLLAARSGDIEFQSAEEDDGIEIGILRISDDASFEVADGQHRTLASIEECKEADRLAVLAGNRPDFLIGDRVGVTIVVENDRAKRRQDWHDINDTAKAPNKSVAVSFDTRSPIGKLVRAIMNDVPIFADDLVEDRANTVRRNDPRRLYTANNVSSALTAFVLGSTRKGRTQAEREMEDRAGPQDKFLQVESSAARYFVALGVLPGWKEVLDLGDRITLEEVQAVRDKYLHLSGLGLNMLGLLGWHCERNDWDINEFSQCLARDIDWRRSNPLWHGVVLIPREVEGDDGEKAVSYGVARGGDVIDEGVRLILDKAQRKGFVQKVV
ncbi:MAG TPA: DNA sulfur modification protein DndB [Dehalococcoidia bacterium]|nr:DNA sulfur modification protein DndB [Dehalococcoidia bacterium]